MGHIWQNVGLLGADNPHPGKVGFLSNSSSKLDVLVPPPQFLYRKPQNKKKKEKKNFENSKKTMQGKNPLHNDEFTWENCHVVNFFLFNFYKTFFGAFPEEL